MPELYVVKRIAQALMTVFVVVSLTFALIRLLPGGPVDYIRAQLIQDPAIDQQELYAIVELYTNVNPQRPLFEQYAHYMVNVVQGDFGRSILLQRSVTEILSQAIPWTVFVTSISLALIYVSGVLLGTFMAYYEGGNFDFGSTSVGITLASIPYYVYALVFLFILSYQLGWFPTGGRVSEVDPGFTWAFVSSTIYHALLPITSLVLPGFGPVALSMRGNSISTLGSDYVRVARLRGLPEQHVALWYVGYNSVLPLYTRLMISIGFIFGGSVVLETLFRYIGVGYYLFRGLSSRDYPLMMGCFILITTAVVIGILIADLTYSLIDPRIEQGGSSETY